MQHSFSPLLDSGPIVLSNTQNKSVCCNLFAGDLKTLKRQMERKNISVVTSAGEKVSFCVFDSTIGLESRRGEKTMLHSCTMYIYYRAKRFSFFSLFID